MHYTSFALFMSTSQYYGYFSIESAEFWALILTPIAQKNDFVQNDSQIIVIETT